MPEPFTLPFVQRGMVEVALLAIGAGVLGTWVVLRGLAFYVHAVGTAAFPGLVLADGLALPALSGAAATGLLVAVAVAWLARRPGGRDSLDTVTALVLVAALAAGVILASDVFGSGARVESLLFGSLLLVDGGDLAFAAAVAATALAAGALLGRRWLAGGFDPGAGRALGLRSALPDLVLLTLVASAALAALAAVGALLTTALLVVPAATTRLLCERLATWQAATVALAVVEGVTGLWLSVELNAPPGAAIAVLCGTVFALVAAARALLRRPRALAAVASACALAAIAAGCGAGSGDPDAGGDGRRVRVVVTTTQLADVVRAVGGEAVSVHGILRPNTDAHEYEPRPRDVQAVAGADVVFVSGAGLDDWMADVVRQGGGEARVVDLSQRAVGAARGDPHWFQDPLSMAAAVPAIRDALGAADPRARRPAPAPAAAAYAARLRALHRDVARCLAGVPRAQRRLVADHDAFGPFAARYGIEVVGAVIPAQTTLAQSSAGDVSRLSALIRRERVRAIFPEHAVSPRLARAIAAQTGATSRYALYGDALGPAGSPGATYVGMVGANADALVRGFTGGARGCAPRPR